MPPARFFNVLGPQARLAVAVGPVLLALVVRLALGKGRLARVLIVLGIAWLGLNWLLAPLSSDMRQELLTLRAIFQ